MELRSKVYFLMDIFRLDDAFKKFSLAGYVIYLLICICELLFDGPAVTVPGAHYEWSNMLATAQ